MRNIAEQFDNDIEAYSEADRAAGWHQDSVGGQYVPGFESPQAARLSKAGQNGQPFPQKSHTKEDSWTSQASAGNPRAAGTFMHATIHAWLSNKRAEHGVLTLHELADLMEKELEDGKISPSIKAGEEVLLDIRALIRYWRAQSPLTVHF